MLRILGIGSRTATDFTSVLQPAVLQACRVTCLVPQEEKTAVGLRAVEVPWLKRGAAKKRTPKMGVRGYQPTRKAPTLGVCTERRRAKVVPPEVILCFQSVEPLRRSPADKIWQRSTGKLSVLATASALLRKGARLGSGGDRNRDASRKDSRRLRHPT